MPSPENAISATASRIATIVPIPYCACFTRFPVAKSEAECFLLVVLGLNPAENHWNEPLLVLFPTPEFGDLSELLNIFPKLENPFAPLPNMLCAEPRLVSTSTNSTGISFTNRLLGLAL